MERSRAPWALQPDIIIPAVGGEDGGEVGGGKDGHPPLHQQVDRGADAVQVARQIGQVPVEQRFEAVLEGNQAR